MLSVDGSSGTVEDVENFAKVDVPSAWSATTHTVPVLQRSLVKLINIFIIDNLFTIVTEKNDTAKTETKFTFIYIYRVPLKNQGLSFYIFITSDLICTNFGTLSNLLNKKGQEPSTSC